MSIETYLVVIMGLKGKTILAVCKIPSLEVILTTDGIYSISYYHLLGDQVDLNLFVPYIGFYIKSHPSSSEFSTLTGSGLQDFKEESFLVPRGYPGDRSSYTKLCPSLR